MKTYFITGATGSIGASLVPLLLEDRETRVRLLIRARDTGHLEERLSGLRKFWGLDEGGEGSASRIRAIPGDAVLPHFGIPEKEFRTLAGECTHIVHSAGNVRMNLPLEEARKSSLDAARGIVAFARAGQQGSAVPKIEFISTVGVGGKTRGQLPESWINGQRLFHNTYEEAKAEAEGFIQREIEAGMPITVHRPSMVVGDSRSGKIIHFQIFYHLCEFLSGRRTMGIVPRIRGMFLDIIPADYVAAAIKWSSTESKSAGRILHLCSGREKSIEIESLRQQVCGVYARAGEKIPSSMVVPFPLFKSCLPLIRLCVTQSVKRAMAVLPFMFDYLGQEQSFGNRDTQRLLEAQGMVLPSPGAYLDRVLQYFLGARRSS